MPDFFKAQMDYIYFFYGLSFLILSVICFTIKKEKTGGLIRILGSNIEVTKNDGLQLKEGKYIRISIEDQGIGIFEENLPKIFDPYFSTKDTYSQRGMGLGLEVCYSLIKKHDGLITVESAIGKGTSVHIYLLAAVA